MHAREADLFAPRARTGERLEETKGRRGISRVANIENFADDVTQLHFRLPSVYHLELRIYRGLQSMLAKKPDAKCIDGRNPGAVVGLAAFG